MAEYNPNDGLMKTNEAVGIVGYGAYVPRFRLPATEVSKMWTGGKGGVPIKEKAVNGLDEDVISMSIEAARNAMDRAEVDPRPSERFGSAAKAIRMPSSRPALSWPRQSEPFPTRKRPIGNLPARRVQRPCRQLLALSAQGWPSMP